MAVGSSGVCEIFGGAAEGTPCRKHVVISGHPVVLTPILTGRVRQCAGQHFSNSDRRRRGWRGAGRDSWRARAEREEWEQQGGTEEWEYKREATDRGSIIEKKQHCHITAVTLWY